MVVVPPSPARAGGAGPTESSGPRHEHRGRRGALPQWNERRGVMMPPRCHRRRRQRGSRKEPRHAFIVRVIIALLLALSPSELVLAREASPAPSPADLPPLLGEWAAAVNSGDVDRVLALFTEDGLWEEVAIGLAARGPDEIGVHLDRLFTAVPDITFDVSSSFMAGDRAVTEWTVSGTYSSDFPGLPPAAGQRFSFRGASVFELADGKIQRYTEYWDAYGFLVQLGASPAPAAAGTPMP